MKLLNDYTEDELANITSEAKQQIFLLECANRGVTLPSATPKYIPNPERDPKLSTDTTIYAIRQGYNNVCFAKDQKSADAIVKALLDGSVKADYHYVNNEKQYFIETNERSFEISATPAYSANLYNELKENISEYDKNIKSIEKNNSSRQEIIDKQDAVMSDIDDAIATADRNINEAGSLAKLFEEYLSMANKDREVAIRFFLNSSYERVTVFANEPERLKTIGITSEELSGFETANKPEEE